MWTKIFFTRWPKEDENKVSVYRALVIVSESPSKWGCCIPISVAKITARLTANISNNSVLQGFPTFLAKATCPDESRTTTPILATSLSLNIAPSKFILYSPGFGCNHLPLYHFYRFAAARVVSALPENL